MALARWKARAVFQGRRLLPALRLLPGCVRYEKGVLSLLRNLKHGS